MSGDDLGQAARALLDACRAKGLMIATAESCTGGMIAALLTEIPGSSAVVERGFVTYSNAAKETMLGVSTATLQQYGAVSAETAAAMACGAIAQSQADIAVSVTGIAGPGGGTAEKPVGLVQFGAAARGGRMLTREMRFGDIGRSEIRHRSVGVALEMLMQLAGEAPAKPQA
jgi:nicotinamide-nucleotide amidase